MTFKEAMASDRVKEIARDVLEGVTGESHRGAMIISVTILEDYLKECIEGIYPGNKSGKLYRSLFGERGQFGDIYKSSTYSYAFGYINENAYTSIDKLRDLRNKAAQSKIPFDLNSEKYQQKFREIFDLGPGMSQYVHNVSLGALTEYKIHLIKEFLDSISDDDEEKQKWWDEEVVRNEGIATGIAHQLPYIMLSHGIEIICGYVTYTFKKKVLDINFNK